MNTEKAIKLLREMQEAWKLQITGDAFDALEMAITALQELDKNQTKPNNSTEKVNNSTTTKDNSIKDCISRHDAISRIQNAYVNTEEGTYRAAVNINVGLTKALHIMQDMPSAQPVAKDTISRQGEFEKRLHDMFDHIWYCEIDHPIFQDTVGDLMRAVIEAHYRALRSDIVRCRDCEYGKQDEYGRWYCRDLGCQIGDEDGSGFCANAERRTDEQT